jgi:hypothetical protein
MCAHMTQKSKALGGGMRSRCLVKPRRQETTPTNSTGRGIRRHGHSLIAGVQVVIPDNIGSPRLPEVDAPPPVFVSMGPSLAASFRALPGKKKTHARASPLHSAVGLRGGQRQKSRRPAGMKTRRGPRLRPCPPPPSLSEGKKDRARSATGPAVGVGGLGARVAGKQSWCGMGVVLGGDIWVPASSSLLRGGSFGGAMMGWENAVVHTREGRTPTCR